jgi:hypothetical protein
VPDRHVGGVQLGLECRQNRSINEIDVGIGGDTENMHQFDGADLAFECRRGWRHLVNEPEELRVIVGVLLADHVALVAEGTELLEIKLDAVESSAAQLLVQQLLRRRIGEQASLLQIHADMLLIGEANVLAAVAAVVEMILSIPDDLEVRILFNQTNFLDDLDTAPCTAASATICMRVVVKWTTCRAGGQTAGRLVGRRADIRQ